MTQKDTTKSIRRYALAFLSILCLSILIAASILQISNRPARAATYDPSLVFGTNLGLNDSSDQVYSSQAARTTLQQNAIHIVRLPLRTINGSDDDQLVANTVKELVAGGFTPLVVLHGAADSSVLKDDQNAVNAINAAVGNTLVYYEYGNEEDVANPVVTTQQYTTSWNTVIHQLSPDNGRFIGPALSSGGTNYKGGDNQAYMQYFVQNANPRPFALSWHEYTCWATDPDSTCLSNIDKWTTHIQSIRSFMSANIGTVLPIMITEWNFNAGDNDPRLNQSSFVTQWTDKALQTLISDQVFASMQYAASNANTQLLLNSDNSATVQLTAMSAYYQSLSTPTPTPTTPSTSTPTPIPTTASTPTPAPTTTSTPTPTSGPIYSFEDGGVDGWSSTGHVTSLTNSTTASGQDGTHALKVVFYSSSSSDLPYISVAPTSGPTSGQTLTAYVYDPSGTSTTIQAKLYVQDSGGTWYMETAKTLVVPNWNYLSYQVPTISGNATRIGIQFYESPNNTSTTVYVDSVTWS
jgi:hypothetical protein